MSKVLSVTIAVLLSAGAGAAFAQPGPNGHNDGGLCTAYFNGQKKGHNKDGRTSPAPFAALEAAAGDADGDGESGTPNDVLTFCGGPEAINGNPGKNGRFTGCFDGDSDEDGNPCND